jgi:hypothetical protein
MNPSTIKRLLPPNITHISQWLTWALGDVPKNEWKFLAMDIMQLMDELDDVTITTPKMQWIRNMSYHLNTSVNSWNCPICCKYCGRTLHDRHGEKCLGNSTHSSNNYQWYKYNNKYVCLICYNIYDTAQKLVGHLLQHHESDVNIFGMT